MQSTVDQILDSWRNGARPDARAALAKHPDLIRDASAVYDLALTEYQMRRAAGEDLTTTLFCEQFSTYRDELRRLLIVEQGISSLVCDAPWPAIGDTFDDFTLCRVLGMGAASRVYLAKQSNIADRLVALKITPFGIGEAQTLGKLAHDHVVPILSVHEDRASGLSAVCMPYMGSATLHDVVRAAWSKKGPPAVPDPRIIADIAAAVPEAPPEAFAADRAPRVFRTGTYWQAIAHLAADIADALAYTHARHVLHHDLKPSNVLLTPSCRAMLLDFNLAWDPYRDGARLGGTLPYMSPEQFTQTFFSTEHPDPILTGPPSDIYSLGVILFELCTGQHPHPLNLLQPSECLDALALGHFRGAPPVRGINPRVPRALASIIDACLKTERALRPKSAAELASRLRRAMGLTDASTTRLTNRRVLAGTIAATVVISGVVLTATSLNSTPSSNAPLRPAAVAATSKSTAASVSARDSLSARIARINALEDAGDFASAIVELRRQIANTPSSELREHLAYDLVRNSDIPEATAVLQELCDERPHEARLLNNLAYCEIRQGNGDRAALLLERAIRLDDQNYVFWHNRVHCMLRRTFTRFDPALGADAIQRAIDLAPEETSVLHVTAARFYVRCITDQVDIGIDCEARLRTHVQAAARLGCPSEILTSFIHIPQVQWRAWFDQSLFDARTNSDSSVWPTQAYIDCYLPPPPADNASALVSSDQANR